MNTPTVRIAPGLRAALFGLFLATAALAQFAQVTGRVTDGSGAVVPDVKITIVNTGTGLSRDTATNELGYYTLPLLPPGAYKIAAEKAGFGGKQRTGIVLEVDQRAALDFTLEIGAVTQQVTVEAAAPLLDTVGPSVGQVIENRRVVELPLNGRNYSDLALLSSGASNPVSGGRLGGFSSGGQRISANNYLLDGADNNSYELAGAGRISEMVKPSVDAIQEFKVQTNVYSAEYGRGTGAVVNVTIKSGTNDLHGSLFEFVRNDAFDAKNFFASPTAPAPKYRRNQYGFSAGAPVIRNKTFLFGDWEGTNIRQGQTVTSTIPTLGMRGGDFSQEIATRVIKDPATGAAFPNNVIPASMIDPVAQKLINLYPAPRNSSLTSNYLYGGPSDEDDQRYDIRLDHIFRPADNVYVRASHYGVVAPAQLNLPPPAFGSNGFDQDVSGWNNSVGWNHIFSAALISVTRASWSYNQFSRANPAVGGSANLNALYGVKGGDNTVKGAMSDFAITGYRQLGIGPNNPTIRDSQNRQVMSDLNWSHGAHNLKFGANVLRIQNNIANSNRNIGSYSFNGQFTGDAAADFLLGWASQYQISTVEHVNLRGWLLAGYVQDDWKLTPRLTVNLGVRYEVARPFYDTHNQMANFDMDTNPSQPALVLAADGGGYNARSLVATQPNGWEPRIGLSYQVTAKTVVRTGYGIFRTYFEPMGDTQFLTGNPPFAYTVTLASSRTAPALLLQNGPPPGVLALNNAAGGLVFSSYERDPHRAYAQQWNFNVQRQIGASWLLEAGYSGAKGVHLLNRYDGNFAPPGPGNINANRPIRSIVIPPSGFVASPLGGVYRNVFNGNSNYHALVAKIEKRLSKGLTLLSSFTWSKAIGDVCSDAADGNASNCGFQNPLNMRAERSLDNQDQRYRFSTSALYDLPVGRGRRWGAQMPRYLDALAGGWGLGGIFSVRAGMPYSIVVNGNPANSGSIQIVNRPNLAGDPYATPWSLAAAFNTAAFASAGLYRYGNLGRNTMTTHGVTNLDLVMSKTFAVTERLRMQFRFEAFNATNTPPFGGPPGATLGTNDFGQITSAGPPRDLQFGLKALF